MAVIPKTIKHMNENISRIESFNLSCLSINLSPIQKEQISLFFSKLGKTLHFEEMPLNLTESIEFNSHNEKILVVDPSELDSIEVKWLNQISNLHQTPCFIVINEKDSQFSELKKSISVNHPYINFVRTNHFERDMKEAIDKIANTIGIKLLKQKKQRKYQFNKVFSPHFLSGLLILAPAINLLLHLTHKDISITDLFIALVQKNNIITFLQFFVILPLAGYAPLRKKSWSLIALISLQVYLLSQIFTPTNLSINGNDYILHFDYGFLVFYNAVLAGFFTNRLYKTYWNLNFKLWRDTQRFKTELPILYATKDEKRPSKITNISLSGAYFEAEEELNIGDKVQLQFILNGKVHSLEATVRRTQHQSTKQLVGHGIEFTKIEDPMKNSLNSYLEGLTSRIQ